ncbi:hypothetical protein IAE38_004742, partial [Pseudomonas sp. S32]|nr:hypothetical protein [Pseudomonas sp. S32]
MKKCEIRHFVDMVIFDVLQKCEICNFVDLVIFDFDVL